MIGPSPLPRRHSALVSGREEVRRANLLFALFLLAHVAVWTLVPALTRGNLDRWGDMLENFAWGQEWQWGYYKHPPFFAWVSAFWLNLTTTSPWSYFLLSQLNVAVGFVAIRAIAREYLSPARAVLAVMLLELVPVYTFLSFKFNANTILLSLWPLTALFALYGVTRGGNRHWLLCGVFAACSLLSKYYSVLFLATLGVALLAHRDGRRCFRSPGPYVAVAAALALMAPHFWWLVQGDFPPVRYALGHVSAGENAHYGKVVKFAAMNLLYVTPLVIASLLIGGRMRQAGSLRRVVDGSFESVFSLLVCFGPFVLTILCAVLLRIRLSSVWGIPLWFMSSVVLLGAYGADIDSKRFRRAAMAVMAIVFAMPTVGLGVVAMSAHVKSVYGFPGRELATQLTARWRDEYGRALRVVGGSKVCANSIAFYSPDHPSVLIEFDYALSPWISPRRIRDEGLAIVCERHDSACASSARRLVPHGGAMGELSVGGSDGLFRHSRAASFVYLFVPPRME